MRRGVLLTVALIGAAILLSIAPAGADPRDDAAGLYGRLINQSQCAEALPEAAAFTHSPGFAALDAEQRGDFLYRVMQCAWRSEAAEAAFAAADDAAGLGADWAPSALVHLALRFDNDARAVNAFEALAASAPDEARKLENRTIWGVLRAAGALGEDRARVMAVHERLIGLNYVPPEGFHDDGLRMDYARELMRVGNVERARERLSSVIDPRLLLAVRVDKRFDPLRGDPAFEAKLDLAAAAEAMLARARADIAAHPRRLAPMLDVAQTLRALGRPEEALAELRAVLRRAHSGIGPSLFDDHEDYLNWLLNEEAYVLYALGRAEDARTAMRHSIMARERGEPSVSQVINFASMLQSEGRSREALEVLSELGDASPYGDMWAANVRACAADQLGDRAVREEALAFVRAHEADNRAAFTATLICVNDLDGAAASYLRRLADPDQREDALTALQIYRPESPHTLPRARVLQERLAHIRARADVRAAVEAVGRIEHVPLAAVYWGDV